ncbi:conjugative transfer ATPase [Vibrio campbellii]|uniref:conjugative transfer ATPase n=1 Tax=Vibrio campbellii TaxID=680 RepID=UPI00215D4FD4|nr:conjugative transfer ATPase [Vibrio campbellii]MCR9909671.1 conjugative transfer ATPase [Vibrio campbellii]
MIRALERLNSKSGSKFSNVASQIQRFLMPEKEAIHSISDRRGLYKEAKCFADFLPYAEFLDDESMMLMDDLVSVSAAWEIDMASSEAVSESVLEGIEDNIFACLDRVTKATLANGQYVLSAYTNDVYDLSTDYQEIEASIHPAWKGSALADAYLSSVKRMFKGLESDNGLFHEGDGATSRPFRGGRRVPKLFLYRRVPLMSRSGKDDIRNNEIRQLKELREDIEDGLRAQGVRLKRMKREGFYEFMVRWLNPKPAATEGSINKLLEINPCPPKELAALESELPLSFLFNTPKTDSDKGIIEFDGCPSRFIQVDRISRVPSAGMVTAEKGVVVNDKVEQVSTFDLLPTGTTFVKHIFFQAQEEVEKKVQEAEENSQFIDSRAKLTNEEAIETRQALAQGAVLLKVEMGFYVTAMTMERLDQKSRQISNIAQSKLGLGVIEPKNNLFPVESYIRNFPLVTDPMLDSRRRRGRMSWMHHSISLMPFIGRKRGNEHRKDKRCMTMFNRGGEVLNIDLLNREANAHAVLLGPTGTGKSATLNKMIVEVLLFHNARLVLAEAGLSFDPIMDFLEAQELDVQRVNINSGKMGKPIAPFANARKAREKVLKEMHENGLSGEVVVESLLQKLPEYFWNLNELHAEEEDSEEKKAEAARKMAIVIEETMKDFNVSKDKLEKDYLGECVMIAKIMVTGGKVKEEENFRLRDETHLGEAIMEAVTIADLNGEDLVRPAHVVQALRARANNTQLGLDENMKSRLNEMADVMAMYTTGVRGDVLNKQAEGFRKCDCLHVELGIAQRSGYEDLLCLSYLALLNQVNDIAERKELEGDERPIYLITDEAHLILNHPMLAPVAIKIVRMWRKYGAWFLTATQDTTSFKGGAEAILILAEMFITLAPPESEIERLKSLLKLTDEQESLLRSSRFVQKTYTEGIYLNRQRKSGTLFRILQPSFCLSLAGTSDEEKQERQATMRKYNVRMAGASLIEAAKLDRVRRLINEDELEKEIHQIVTDTRYALAA